MLYSANISRNHSISDTRRQVTDADGVVEQDNHYYPYGMLMGESSDILTANTSATANPYLYGGKEYIATAGANLLDFTARTYDPSLPLFHTQDPNSGSYTPFNPYLYCGSDPVNRIDPDGRKWIIDESKDGKSIKLRLTGVVINTSTETFDMKEVADAIVSQLNRVYTFSNKDISVTMDADIRAVTSADEIESDDHVFRIKNQTSFIKGRLAEAVVDGLDVKLGTKLVNQTLSGENNRTIAHEVGHTGGLFDTHLPDNSLPIDNMNTNLMTMIESLERGADKNKATNLQTNQIREIVNKYKTGKLNRYSPLRERYNPHLLPQWPFFKLTNKYLSK